MKKLLLLMISAVLMVLIGTTSAFAGTEKRVYDYAGILSQDEAAQLNEELDVVSQEMDMDIVALTSDYKDGKTLRQYADDFYDYNGFGFGEDKRGVVIFIDMEDRTVYLGTTGQAINYFTDARIYNMTDGDDTLYEYLSDGDYKAAIERCAARLLDYYRQGIEADQHTVIETEAESPVKRLTLFEIIIAVLIPGIIGLLVIKNIKDEYAMKKEKSQSQNFRLAYQATCAFAFAAAGDDLLDRQVTRRIIPIATGNKSSGSHGQSTIHMGGSGTFHGGGGGGRHF